MYHCGRYRSSTIALSSCYEPHWHKLILLHYPHLQWNICCKLCLLVYRVIRYSRNAYELQSSDILMITLLAKDLFPSGERLETLFSHSYRNTESSSSSGEQRLTQGTKYYPHRPDLYESAFEGDDEDSEGDDEVRWTDEQNIGSLSRCGITYLFNIMWTSNMQATRACDQ